jgi:hypothetical protein
MKKQLLPAVIALISLTACNGHAPEETTSDTTASAMPATTTSVDTSKSVFSDVKPSATPTPQTLPAAGQPSTSTAGLNPEHGKPGHRCDIAVGAPLNSAPQQIQQTIPSPQPSPAGQTGTVKLNPAHGQPGHDCAVPVGQPLKS